MVCTPTMSNEKEDERCKYKKNQNVFWRKRGEHVLPCGNMFQGIHRADCGLSQHKGTVCHLFSHFHSKMAETQRPNQKKGASAQNKKRFHNFNIPNDSKASRRIGNFVDEAGFVVGDVHHAARLDKNINGASKRSITVKPT